MIDTTNLERCVNTEYNDCINCPYGDRTACKFYLLTDVLKTLKEEQKFRKVMFNRCATATMRVMDKNACGMCIFREDCEKERTVNPW